MCALGDEPASAMLRGRDRKIAAGGRNLTRASGRLYRRLKNSLCPASFCATLFLLRDKMTETRKLVAILAINVVGYSH